MPLFLAAIAAASLAIFNYQKSSSPVTAAALYALRTSPRAREVLGDEIYFGRRIPWISGEINQVQGRIDVSFAVRGTRGRGLMRFVSRRPAARAAYETLEWSLEMPDGDKIDLLGAAAAGGDPFRTMPGLALALEHDGLAEAGEDDQEAEATRGFRQRNK